MRGHISLPQLQRCLVDPTQIRERLNLWYLQQEPIQVEGCSCVGVVFRLSSHFNLLTKIPFSPCQITAPYLHIGAITIMVLLSWPVALHAIRAHKKGTVTLLPAPCMKKDVCQRGKTGMQEPFIPTPAPQMEVTFSLCVSQGN